MTSEPKHLFPSRPKPRQKCDGCGVCCLELGTPPFLGFEVYQLPEDLRAEVLEKGFCSETEGGQPCYWWDEKTKTCSEYENRPQLCRDFKAGGDSCLDFRKFYGINS